MGVLLLQRFQNLEVKLSEGCDAPPIIGDVRFNFCDISFDFCNALFNFSDNSLDFCGFPFDFCNALFNFCERSSDLWGICFDFCKASFNFSDKHLCGILFNCSGGWIGRNPCSSTSKELVSELVLSLKGKRFKILVLFGDKNIFLL